MSKNNVSIVGNIAVNNNLISGFSNSNYALFGLPKTFATNDVTSFVIKERVRCDASPTNYNRCIQSDTSSNDDTMDGFFTQHDATQHLLVWGAYGTYYTYSAKNVEASDIGRFIDFKYEYENGVLTCSYSLDNGQTYITGNTYSNIPVRNFLWTKYRIGSKQNASDSIFNGTVDLSGCSVEVNNEMLWRGTIPSWSLSNNITRAGWVAISQDGKEVEANNFRDNSYLALKSVPAVTNSFDLTAVVTVDLSYRYQTLFSSNNAWLFGMNNGAFGFYTDTTGTVLNTVLTNGNTYWLRGILTPTSYSTYSYPYTEGVEPPTDISQWTFSSSTTNSTALTKIANAISSGCRITGNADSRYLDQYWRGKLRLDELVVKVDGIIVATGTNAIPDKYFVPSRKVSTLRYTLQNLTQDGGILSSDLIYIGGNGCSLTSNEVLPLSTANSWEFQTKYMYNGGGSYPAIFGYAGGVDYKSPSLSVVRGYLKMNLSSNGIDWDLNSSLSTLAPVNGTVYYFKAGFTGTEYYIDYNTTGWNDAFTRVFTLNSTTKVHCSVPIMFMNLSLNSNYWSGGFMDLKETKFTVDNVVYEYSTSSQVPIPKPYIPVRKVVNNIYKPYIPTRKS